MTLDKILSLIAMHSARAFFFRKLRLQVEYTLDARLRQREREVVKRHHARERELLLDVGPVVEGDCVDVNPPPHLAAALALGQRLRLRLRR